MKKYIIIYAAIIVSLIAVVTCTYTVQENQSVIILRMGKAKTVETNPGLHIKAPFVDSVTKVYLGDRLYDIPTSDVITSDKKSMIVDNYVVWQVEDPKKFYQTLGAVEDKAKQRIDAAVYNATKNTISSMTQDEIIAARGMTLTDLITKASNSDISQYGVNIEIAEIKALDLPEDNKNAVYERMISERNNIAASYKAKGEAEAKKIRNETDKQVTIINSTAEAEAAKTTAEGEAEYMRILSNAYNDPDKSDFYNYLRGLDSLSAMAGENKTLILDKDSEYTKMLYN